MEEIKTEIKTETKQETLIDFINHPDFLKPYRLNNESDLHYKTRKKINEFYLKEKRKGHLVWISKDISKETKGFTYNKEQVKRALTSKQINKQI